MDTEFSMTLKATHGGKRKLLMDGKRSSIVIFLNRIQVVSRMKHRKSGNKAASQVRYGWTAGPSPLSGLRLQGRKQSKTLESGGLSFHAFSWIKPGCNQETCNKDPYLSIYAKEIFL
jgi:hypothetical protein